MSFPSDAKYWPKSLLQKFLDQITWFKWCQAKNPVDFCLVPQVIHICHIIIECSHLLDKPLFLCYPDALPSLSSSTLLKWGHTSEYCLLTTGSGWRFPIETPLPSPEVESSQPPSTLQSNPEFAKFIFLETYSCTPSSH